MRREATPLPPSSAPSQARALGSRGHPLGFPARWAAPAWIEAAAAILILFGVAARLLVSSASVLAKDESYHLHIAGSGGWIDTYCSLTGWAVQPRAAVQNETSGSNSAQSMTMSAGRRLTLATSPERPHPRDLTRAAPPPAGTTQRLASRPSHSPSRTRFAAASR